MALLPGTIVLVVITAEVVRDCRPDGADVVWVRCSGSGEQTLINSLAIFPLRGVVGGRVATMQDRLCAEDAPLSQGTKRTTEDIGPDEDERTSPYV